MSLIFSYFFPLDLLLVLGRYRALSTGTIFFSVSPYLIQLGHINNSEPQYMEEKKAEWGKVLVYRLTKGGNNKRQIESSIKIPGSFRNWRSHAPLTVGSGLSFLKDQ